MLPDLEQAVDMPVDVTPAAGPSIIGVDGRMPVLIGAGTSPGTAEELASTRDGSGSEGRSRDHLDVMTAAARAALADTGIDATFLAERVGMVAVTEGSWSAGAGGHDEVRDPARIVAARLGITDTRTVRADIGVAQCTLVRVAAQRIAAGEIDVALIVGGEAKATALRQARNAGPAALPVSSLSSTDVDAGSTEPDEHWRPTGELMSAAEIEAGLWDPVQQYACIDNALAAAHGLDRRTQLERTAELWHRFNLVARDEPLAWFDEARSTDFLRSPGPGNRALADPYAKWHSTQWAVDQGAAMVLCAADVAERLGVAADRVVYPHVLIESSAALSLALRAEMHRWPAMEALAEAAVAHLGRPLSAIGMAELYSCFPSAVKVQQIELGLDPDATPTITGGMSFAGGPFNNFTYQAAAAVVARLRRDGGDAVVTTVSGLLTKPGLAVWSREAPRDGLLVGDLADRASAVTDAVTCTSTHVGRGTVATCTVSHVRGEPDRTFVIADLHGGEGHGGEGHGVEGHGGEWPDADRWVGVSHEPELVAAALGGTLIGRSVDVDGMTCKLVEPSGADGPTVQP